MGTMKFEPNLNWADGPIRGQKRWTELSPLVNMEESNSSFTLCKIDQPILTNEIARYKPHAGFNETFFFSKTIFFPPYICLLFIK